MDIRVGDVVTMKKKHPCGAAEWRVLRVGADFRMECTGCGHTILAPRLKIEKNIRNVRRGESGSAGE